MGPWIVREALKSLDHLEIASAVRHVCAAQDAARRWGVILIGKNAADMMGGISFPDFSGIAVGPAETLPVKARRGWTLLSGDHPVPGKGSFSAGKSVLEFAEDPSHDAFLIGLSGGGSALAEAPLAPWFTSADLRRAHRDLLASSLSIRQINTVRKRLSALKGGRLARRMGARPAVTVLLSDVPGGHENSIASGPTLPDDSLHFDAYYIARRFREAPWAAKLLRVLPALPETPKPDDPVFRNKTGVLLFDNARLLEHLQSRIGERYAARILMSNAGGKAQEILPGLVEAAQGLKPGEALLSGGEFTLDLPRRHGRGGRVAHLGLLLLKSLREAGVPEGIGAFGLATDGSDGTSPDPGFRFESPEMDLKAAQRALARFDAGTYFHARGLGIPRPRHALNLRDVFILWRND